MSHLRRPFAYPNRYQCSVRNSVHYKFFDSLCTLTEGAEEEDRESFNEKNTDGDLDRRRVFGGGENGGHRQREFNGSIVGDGCGNGSGGFGDSSKPRLRFGAEVGLASDGSVEKVEKEGRGVRRRGGFVGMREGEGEVGVGRE
ncbi:hypothetical protein Acr_07g0011520 [Actinidia rufa]|uniref:Uncharacterized protein n=1 Tax=Actinidia rufa TaxID=165716 RepID=A0A7J0EXN8_9ERIC|nr:hypothetical protein Acr_07g0011520 [Actinidia rufa]